MTDGRGAATGTDYARAWRVFRVRRRIFIVMSLGPLLWLLCAGPRAAPTVPFAPVFIGLAVLSGVVGLSAVAWRCPRCGKPFGMFAVWQNLWAKRCLHCGLPKWSTDPNAG